MLDFGFYNMDCMEGMKQFPDKYFELAIVDPPYGDGGVYSRDRTRADSAACSTSTEARIPQQAVRPIDHLPKSMRQREREREKRTAIHKLRNAGTWSQQNRGNMGGEVLKKIISWDVAPGQDYFDELFRISQNQIIWGGQLLQFTVNTLLFNMAQNKRSAEL